MGYYDGKGYWREDGQSGYDYEGYYRRPGEGGYDSKGIYRRPGEGGYDSKGIYRRPGEGGYDFEGYWRDGQHSAASGRSQKTSYDSCLSETTSSGKSSGGYSGGGIGILDTIFLGFDSLIGFIGRIMIAILVIGIVILIFMFQLARVGILKSKVTISLDLVSNTNMALEDFQLSLACFDDENGECIEYVGEFDPDSNSCTIKVPKGEYTLFFEYGGEKFSIESLSATGLQNYSGEFTDENLLIMRVAEITFQNNEGDIIHPEQLSIVNSEGSDISVELLENGTYTVLLSDDCGEEDWIISAGGYESKEVSFDGDIARVIDIEVILDEE